MSKKLIKPLPLENTLPKHNTRPKIGGTVFSGNVVFYEPGSFLSGSNSVTSSIPNN